MTPPCSHAVGGSGTKSFDEHNLTRCRSAPSEPSAFTHPPSPTAGLRRAEDPMCITLCGMPGSTRPELCARSTQSPFISDSALGALPVTSHADTASHHSVHWTASHAVPAGRGSRQAGRAARRAHLLSIFSLAGNNGTRVARPDYDDPPVPVPIHVASPSSAIDAMRANPRNP